MKHVLILAVLATIASPLVQANADLAKKYACAGCHAPDKKVMGPSWQEVAKMYAGKPGAAAALQAKVKTGGTGVWGKFPMPPNPNVPEADLKALVAWALAGGK